LSRVGIGQKSTSRVVIGRQIYLDQRKEFGLAGDLIQSWTIAKKSNSRRLVLLSDDRILKNKLSRSRAAIQLKKRIDVSCCYRTIEDWRANCTAVLSDSSNITEEYKRSWQSELTNRLSCSRNPKIRPLCAVCEGTHATLQCWEIEKNRSQCPAHWTSKFANEFMEQNEQNQEVTGIRALQTTLSWRDSASAVDVVAGLCHSYHRFWRQRFGIEKSRLLVLRCETRRDDIGWKCKLFRGCYIADVR